jgi:hypothetical protein
VKVVQGAARRHGLQAPRGVPGGGAFTGKGPRGGPLMAKSELITVTGFNLQRTGLVPTQKVTPEQCLAAARALHFIDGCVDWAAGDLLNLTETVYGETYDQVVDELGLEYQRARNDKWVAGVFELSRRRDNLPWSFHREVASLPARQQDKLLDCAGRAHGGPPAAPGFAQGTSGGPGSAPGPPAGSWASWRPRRTYARYSGQVFVEDRGSRMEDGGSRLHPRSSILDPPSSILHPQVPGHGLGGVGRGEQLPPQPVAAARPQRCGHGEPSPSARPSSAGSMRMHATP